jgi:hypothetical protein
MFTWSFLCLCAISFPFSSAIINGDEVPWNKVGYLVKIFARERLSLNSTTSYRSTITCEGSIISPTLILTSTNCIQNDTTFENFNEILVVFVKEKFQFQKKIHASIVRKTETWSLLKLQHPLQINQLCPKNESKRISALNLKLSITRNRAIDINEELKGRECWIVGFKTTNNVRDFLRQETVLKVSLSNLHFPQKRFHPHLLYANVTANQTACLDDTGTAVTCKFQRGDYQIGFVNELLALPSKIKAAKEIEKSKTYLATCSAITQIKITLIIKDFQLYQEIEKKDFESFYNSYSACNIH